MLATQFHALKGPGSGMSNTTDFLLQNRLTQPRSVAWVVSATSFADSTDMGKQTRALVVYTTWQSERTPLRFTPGQEESRPDRMPSRRRGQARANSMCQVSPLLATVSVTPKALPLSLFPSFLKLSPNISPFPLLQAAFRRVSGTRLSTSRTMQLRHLHKTGSATGDEQGPHARRGLAELAARERRGAGDPRSSRA